MTDEIRHEVNLIGGFTDAKRVTHRRVVFGHRITGADLFRLDNDPQSQVATQYEDLVMREAIVEFGTLETKTKKGERKLVPLSALLDLDSIDRDELAAGHNEFEKLSRGERRPSIMPPNRVRLVFGVMIGEQSYDLIEFGNRRTGRDEVAADKLDLKGIARMCYLAGRQVAKVAIACGDCDGSGLNDGAKCKSCAGAGYVAGSDVDGVIELESFSAMDGVDIQAIGAAAELWRQSFRLNGGKVPAVKDGADRTPAGDEDRMDRRAAAGNAAGAA